MSAPDHMEGECCRGIDCTYDDRQGHSIFYHLSSLNFPEEALHKPSIDLQFPKGNMVLKFLPQALFFGNGLERVASSECQSLLAQMVAAENDCNGSVVLK